MNTPSEQNNNDPEHKQGQVDHKLTAEEDELLKNKLLDLELTAEEEELLKKKLEELRKMDPFIYR
jgi:hypothetical protein